MEYSSPLKSISSSSRYLPFKLYSSLSLSSRYWANSSSVWINTVSRLLARAVPMLWTAYPTVPAAIRQASPKSRYLRYSVSFFFVCNLKWLILFPPGSFPFLLTVFYHAAISSSPPRSPAPGSPPPAPFPYPGSGCRWTRSGYLQEPDTAHP